MIKFIKDYFKNKKLAKKELRRVKQEAWEKLSDKEKVRRIKNLVRYPQTPAQFRTKCQYRCKDCGKVK